jgi:hypothetical protein
MNDCLYHIQEILKTKKISDSANKRLFRDFETIYKRLEKDEYETSGIVENIFDIPDKTQQLYKLLETYTQIAKDWSLVLNKIPIYKYKEIVDICPGFAPKVEIGLCYLNYKGKVLLLDNNLKSTKRLIKFIELFNPQFEMSSYSQDIFSLHKEQFSFIIGNHIIDDLILSYFAQKSGTLLINLYEKERELITMWNKILENEEYNFEKITRKLSQIFLSLIRKNGYLCLSIYKSYVERMLDLEKSYKFTRKVFYKLIDILTSNGFTKISCLGNPIKIEVLKNG